MTEPRKEKWMTERYFKWLVDKLDDPNSVLNDPSLWMFREMLVKKLVEYDPLDDCQNERKQ